MDLKLSKEKIKELIEKYEAEKSAGKISQYTEAETKTGFIEPLFQALGWDTQNRDEVGLETAISGGRTDYSFKISGIVKFFVEAKPLKADLHKLEYAEQTINYAWHKGVVWAVLTDFESIKVFNAEWKTKNISENLFFEIKYTEYLANFDQLFLLSKESITNGLLDKSAEKWGKKVKKQPVSKQILDDLLTDRKKLTENILKYPRLNKISEVELDEAVQRILDRLIFIRTCEDRNIEQNHLLTAVRNKKQNLSKELHKIFRGFDNAYNSKLFEPHLCEKLTIDNEALKEIIESLYQTKDGNIHYDFGAINADVLGNIYEQYLGHILKKTEKRAKLKETHQHRKEQGIYYTPTYIVDYIVKNTVGEVLKTAKPKEAQNLKILDPACGSGSFLIRAFDELVNYYQKKSPGEFGYFRKIEILKNNIYGVDLDKQAVEITQMNLLLKTLYRQQKLPMLENIKCRNSLIDDPKVAGAKAFNWSEEFPEICHCEERSDKAISKESQNGFDIIIGNPPYVNLANIKDANMRNYLQEKFATAKNKSDLYSFFVERAITLLKDKGLLGFIISNSWLGTDSFSRFREYLIKNTTVYKLVKLSLGVFEDATVTPILIFVKKEKVKQDYKIELVEYKDNKFEKIPYKLSYKRIIHSPNFSFSFNPEIAFKIDTTKLGKIAKFSLGIKTSNDERFISDEKKDNNSYRLLRGKDVCRYFYKYNGKWIWYKPDLMMQKVGAGPRKLEYFLTEKILFRTITGGSIIATLDTEKYLTNDKVHILYSPDKLSLKFILGIVNSNLIGLWIKSTFNDLLEIKINQLEQIPVPNIDFSNPAEKKMHDDLVKLVDKMLDLNKQLQKFGDKITDDRRKIESEIQKTDNQIDELVYKLYDLTEEEIKIVVEDSK